MTILLSSAMTALYIILPLLLIVGLLVGIFVMAAKKSRNNANGGNPANNATAGKGKRPHANKLCPACQTEYDFYNDISWEEYRRAKNIHLGNMEFVGLSKDETAYVKGVKTCPQCANQVRFNTKVGLGSVNSYDVETALKTKWDAKNSLFNALGDTYGNDGKAF